MQFIVDVVRHLKGAGHLFFFLNTEFGYMKEKAFSRQAAKPLLPQSYFFLSLRPRVSREL